MMYDNELQNSFYQLKEMVTFNSKVIPICLPTEVDENVDAHESHFVTTAGWGENTRNAFEMKTSMEKFFLRVKSQQ